MEKDNTPNADSLTIDECILENAEGLTKSPSVSTEIDIEEYCLSFEEDELDVW
jgi:hypothetical protein